MAQRAVISRGLPPAAGPARGAAGPGTCGRRAGPKAGEESDTDSGSDEEFLRLRKEAKAGRTATIAPRAAQPKAFAPLNPADSDALRLNVDPCYFDYAAGHKALAAAREAAATPPRGNCSLEEADLVEFLRMYGLKGPLKAYAQAFVLQGVRDSVTLVGLDNMRLARVIERVQMDGADELLLAEALLGLR